MMATAIQTVSKTAIRHQRQPWPEICLFLASISLIAQLGGPPLFRWWSELPHPGSQTQGHTTVIANNGGQRDIRYLIYLPKNYSKYKRFPLILFLHGAGQRGEDLDQVAKHGPPALIKEGKNLPFVVASPQCPADSEWDSDVLLKFLDYLQQEFSIDPERIYATGFSMGAYEILELVALAPQRFAAAIPIAGGGNTFATSRLVKLPIWAFHGAEDKTVSPEESKQIVDAIRSAGGTNVRLTLLEGEGHSICDIVFSRTDLWEWLLNQRLSDN
jgi:predicted peptidase